MTELLQPGNHPNADQLSAFAEHALPPHEQQQTLAHLATCAACRNLVYLTQQAAPIELPQPQPVAARRPWFAGWNLALPAALALACLILLTIHLRNATTPNKPAAPTTTASVEPPPPLIPSTPEPTLKPAAPISPPAPAPTPKPERTLDKKQSPLIVLPAQIASAAPLPSPAPIGTAMANASFAALSLRQQVPGSGAIDGRITDPSGAFVPRARITATNTDTGIAITRESTPTGSFSIAPLQPGNYNVEAVAPGFQRLLQANVHVEPTQELALNMKLNVGAANQTVTVTDAPPSLDTTNATLGGTIENELYTNLPLSMAGKPRDPAAFQYLMPGVQQAAAAAPPLSPAAPPQSAQQGVAKQGIYGGSGQTNLNENYIEGIPVRNAGLAVGGAAPATVTASGQATLAVRQINLPSHLPALSMITNARQVLAIDTAGALFRSEDSGVTWLPVATQWQGRATRVALVHPPAAADQLARNKAATSDDATTAAAKPNASQLFELTTDTNITYTSPDGQTWHRK